jgi:DNA-binding MarR family transcriptional regulator
MKNNTVDNIVENLLNVLPIIEKKLLKIDSLYVNCEIRLSRLHVGIMGTIYHEQLPISGIAKKFLIPKPQMTLLINHLVDAGIVTRTPNKDDRRVTDLMLTEKGNAILKRCDKYLKNNVKKQLYHFSETEVEELALSLKKLREVGTVLEKHE